MKPGDNNTNYNLQIARSLVKDKFKEIPEIIECHYTTGNYSLFIKVYTRDNEHLRMVLTDTIQNIEGIVRTETLISLEESINRQIPVLSK